MSAIKNVYFFFKKNHFEYLSNEDSGVSQVFVLSLSSKNTFYMHVEKLIPHLRHGDSSTELQCTPLLLTDSTCPARVAFHLVMIYASQLTLQLGLGDFPTGFGGCDGGSTGCIHERPLQHARPVLLACCQITLPPVLEVVLAFPYSR